MKPITILFCLLLGLAGAQDGLYAPEPPADSAFVRVIHAAPDASPFAALIGPVHYDEVGFQGVSSYRVVPGGSYDVALGDAVSTLEVAPGNFYTVALAGSAEDAKVVAVKDPSNTNLAKSLLILYNFSSEGSVDMKTADGAQAVVSGVAPGTVGSIVVNPVAVDLAAFAASGALESFSGISLERGAAYSMVVMGGNPLSAVWAPSLTQ